jgi:hypothetical protein
MGMKWIRDRYKVPAKRGMEVTAQGIRGTIVGSKNGYLRIRIDERKRILSFHPTWEMKYLSQKEIKR